MPEKESPGTAENVEVRRRARHLEKRRLRDEAAVARLRAVEGSWGELTKLLDGKVRAAFERLTLDEEAANTALRRLRENVCAPVSEGFTIAGKAVDADSSLPLPGLLVKVLRPDAEEPFAEARTNEFGDFTVVVPSEERGPREEVFTFRAFSEPETVIHHEERALQPARGKTQDVTLTLRCAEGLSDRLAAGEAVRDSAKLIADEMSLLRENTKEAHNALKRLTGVTRKRIVELREALSAGMDRALVPDIVTAPPPDVAPTERAAPGAGQPEVRLEDLTGIATVKAGWLRDKGVMDLATFLEKDDEFLRRIVHLDIPTLKAEAADLLRSAGRRPSVESPRGRGGRPPDERKVGKRPRRE